ncbi:hypothetical protein [Methylobacterium soli]|uniref:Uncharacterized protein n=1 Tax=Methylobacterium soli TaxID=553447 RepID=A0A6L3SUF4_9HYPH|nr:hypothetical protein [Methylobacterium soli]KAB1076447.1 hypothetical protein F6X53_23270 [Methylobacterium soli]GJE46954.1 hypothetical protein AEGHOMDF_6163 [Methylobacterium soli]
MKKVSRREQKKLLTHLKFRIEQLSWSDEPDTLTRQDEDDEFGPEAVMDELHEYISESVSDKDIDRAILDLPVEWEELIADLQIYIEIGEIGRKEMVKRKFAGRRTLEGADIDFELTERGEP